MSSRKSIYNLGFSLLEILVASAILGFIVVAFVSFINNSLKAQKNVQNAVDFDILKSNLNLVLNTKSCNGAFQNSTSTPVTITLPTGTTFATLTPSTNVLAGPAKLDVDHIQSGDSVIVKAGQNIGGMTVEELYFSDAVYDGVQSVDIDPDPLVTNMKSYRAFTAQLFVMAKKATGSLGAASLSKTIGVRFLVDDTTGKVERCSQPEAQDPLMEDVYAQGYDQFPRYIVCKFGASIDRVYMALSYINVTGGGGCSPTAKCIGYQSVIDAGTVHGTVYYFKGETGSGQTRGARAFQSVINDCPAQLALDGSLVDP